MRQKKEAKVETKAKKIPKEPKPTSFHVPMTERMYNAYVEELDERIELAASPEDKQLWSARRERTINHYRRRQNWLAKYETKAAT